MNRLDADARCPFYRAITHTRRGGTINCTEGPASARVALNFGRTGDLNDFFELRCCGNYEKCPVCELIMRKYE